MGLALAVPLFPVACAKVAGIDQLEVAACKGGDPCPVAADGSTKPGPDPSSSSSVGDDAPVGSGDTATPGDSQPPPFSCPTGTKGPKMVKVGTSGNEFCIDSTEVTVAQYNEFRASNPDPPNQTGNCAWNTTYVPSTGAPPDAPQAYVNWCDAYAYCAWAGKRLCGKIVQGTNPGAPLAESDINSATVDQWYVACSHAGDRTYPYGNSQNPQACNVSGANGDVAWSPGQKTTCEGGYGGLYDMVGNVWEWSDDCRLVGDAGSDPKTMYYCPARGGSFGNGQPSDCKSIGQYSGIGGSGNDTGIRCCSK